MTTTVKHPVEQWLNERGVDFVLVDLDLSEIDSDASLHNQVRILSLDPETVEKYVRAMKRGDQFPPLLGRRLQDGRVILGDGNHTHAALLKVGTSRFPVYLVDTTDAIFREISFEANVRLNGRENTMEERKLHAVNLVNSSGYKPSDAAKAVGLSTQQVTNALRVHETDLRMTSLGLAKALKLPDSVRRRLGSIKLDPVLITTAKAVVEGKITARELDKVVTEIGTIGSQDEQIAHVNTVANWTQSKAGVKRKGTNLSPMHVLNLHGSALMKVDADTLRFSLAGTEPHTRLAVKQRIEDLKSHLDKLETGL